MLISLPCFFSMVIHVLKGILIRILKNFGPKVEIVTDE